MEEWVAIATAATGYVAQWLRATSKIPNALVDVAILAAAIALYFMGCNCKPVWSREFFVTMFSMVFLLMSSARGSAAYSKDTKAAPRTNSL